MVVLLLLLCVGAATATTVGETQALEDLYNTCNGPSWFNSTNWLVGDPCDNSWYGVGCSNSHVVKLVLASNGVSCAEIPDSIQDLYELMVMDLSDNGVQGGLPAGLAGLKALQHLDWGHNELSGGLTNSLGTLLDFSLTYIDLSFNQLTGTIPTYFDGAQLQYVDLSNNPFVCPIPSWAAYTQATCLNWTISFVESKCVFSDGKFVVVGKHYASESGIECVLVNRTSGEEMSRAYAEVVSDSLLFCPVKYLPSACSTLSGEQLMEYFKLNLAIGSALIVQDPPSVGVVNVLCYSSEVGLPVPNPAVALDICRDSNTSTPWTQAASFSVDPGQYLPVSSFSPNCSSSSGCAAFPGTSATSSFCQGSPSTGYRAQQGWGQLGITPPYYACYDSECVDASDITYYCGGRPLPPSASMRAPMPTATHFRPVPYSYSYGHPTTVPTVIPTATVVPVTPMAGPRPNPSALGTCDGSEASVYSNCNYRVTYYRSLDNCQSNCV